MGLQSGETRSGTACSLPSAGSDAGVTFVPVPRRSSVLPKDGRADGGKWLGPPQTSCCETLAASWSEGNAERFSSGGGMFINTHTFADHFLSSVEEDTRTRRRERRLGQPLEPSHQWPQRPPLAHRQSKAPRMPPASSRRPPPKALLRYEQPNSVAQPRRSSPGAARAAVPRATRWLRLYTSVRTDHKKAISSGYNSVSMRKTPFKSLL